MGMNARYKTQEKFKKLQMKGKKAVRAKADGQNLEETQ